MCVFLDNDPEVFAAVEPVPDAVVAAVCEWLLVWVWSIECVFVVEPPVVPALFPVPAPLKNLFCKFGVELLPSASVSPPRVVLFNATAPFGIPANSVVLLVINITS